MAYYKAGSLFLPASKRPDWCYCTFMLQVLSLQMYCYFFPQNFNWRLIAYTICSCFDYTNGLAVRFPPFWIWMGLLLQLIWMDAKINNIKGGITWFIVAVVTIAWPWVACVIHYAPLQVENSIHFEILAHYLFSHYRVSVVFLLSRCIS